MGGAADAKMLLLLSLLASAQALPIDHGNSPTILQYVLEAVVDLPEWSRYLPEDIDVDKDGNLNEIEVELKFKTYVKDAFEQLDKDVDKLVTQEEFRNASINLNGINKIIDIAMQSYPIKTVFDFADINQDGFLAEDDFLIPENRRKLLQEYYKEKFGDKLPQYWGANQEERGTNWTLKRSVPTFNGTFQNGKQMCAEYFGEKEAQVLCREMGHSGVASVSSTTFEDYLTLINSNSNGRYSYIDLYGFIFDCQGTESSLDECTKTKNEDVDYGRCPDYSKLLASVNCTLNKEIGEVHLAGGKDGSSGDLHIGLEKYCGDISLDMAKVVCTELGFVAGTPLVTTDNFFTSRYGPPSIERRFECNGSEQKLQDCQPVMSYSDERTHCYVASNGVICKPGQVSRLYGTLPGVQNPQNPAYNDGEGGFYDMWEQWGRYVFAADLNDDHKVSMEELGTKIKEIVAAVFQVLDQTDDGVFSASDLTTLNVRLPDVLDLARKLFKVLAKGKQEIDLYNFVILPRPLSSYDHNRDGIINLKDLDVYIDSSQVEGLLTILSRELDPNQDGIILVTELDKYVQGILNHLGRGTMTLDSLWKLMKESQFTCLQINGVRTFVEGMTEFIKTQSREMLDYFFREFDLDGNGEIPVEELYNAHVPCDEVDTYRTLDDNFDRVSCGLIMDQFFLNRGHPKAPRLHRFNLNRRPNNGDRGPNNGNRGSDNFMEKLANSACAAMQPNF